MSINTILTADRTQFKNYLNDGLAIPSNAAVALTKASIDVPLFVQKMLVVPLVPAIARTTSLFKVVIDGIEKDITWRDFYTAFTQYPDAANFANGVDRDITEDLFYGGRYEFFTNNRLYFSLNGVEYNEKAPLLWVLAKAIDNAYQFYQCTDITDYKESFCGIPDFQPLTANYAGGNVVYPRCYVRAVEPTEYKLNIAYEIQSAGDRTPNDAVFDAADVLTWTIGGTGNRLTSVGGAAVNVGYGNGLDIDVNGGYMVATPTLTAGTMAWGISLEGQGSDPATDVYLPKTYANMGLATPIIDIGIQFEIATVGGVNSTVYKIIDGQKQYVFYDGATSQIANLSVFKPYDAVSLFTNANDSFAIVVRRGNILNGNFQFVFDIKMGTGGDLDTYATIYTSTKTLNNPRITLTPAFLSSANAGNIFNDIRYVAIGPDTVLQGQSLTDVQGSRLNTFSLAVGDSVLLDDPGYRDFVNAIGLEYYGADMTILAPDQRIKFDITYGDDPLNKVLSWRPPIIADAQSPNIGGLISAYYVGELTLANIFRFVDSSFQINITNNVLRDIPKYLNVFLLNHTNKNYTGSFLGAGGFLGSSEGEDKMIGTIPFEVENPNVSQIVQISYETYNPYYRPLNNPHVFTTNEFIVEISYKDFRTDEKHQINQIDGLVKVELNFIKRNNQNVKRITGEVVPII